MTKPQTRTLRLILGDQLNASHSWFQQKDPNVVYLIAELGQEASYVKHHIQKLLAFFMAMESFGSALTKAGHQVQHMTLDDTQQYADLAELLSSLCLSLDISALEYQRPDEYRLQQQLLGLEIDGVVLHEVESEHFVLPFEEIPTYFKPDKGSRLETFYRKMRQRHDILMRDGEPVGGQWNFDADNRNKLKPDDLAQIPAPLMFRNDHSIALDRITRHKIDHFGEAGESLIWPTTRQQSLELLEFFCAYCLPQFGRFQDSMTAKSPHSWSLYHSRLSFSLNTKMLSPMQVINRAVKEYETRPNEISLAQIEGFVRQILGWREFVRGIYWVNMPSYSKVNALDASRDLPSYFWTGKTSMRCMQHALGQSLEHAYGHHIHRLMVIGNFCLLTGIDPAQVDAWYLGVYIDAIEWVEMPNTRGMSQFADGGLLASKPYTASGAYINRMSDYCADCSYSVKEKIGSNACPFNSLYWHFMDRHKDKFAGNPRIGMVYRNLEKMDTELRQKTLQRAAGLLSNLDEL